MRRSLEIARLLGLLALLASAAIQGLSGTGAALAEETMAAPGAVLLYEKPLQSFARAVSEAYPSARARVEETLGWKVDFRPYIRLVGDAGRFRLMAGNDVAVALAAPEQNAVALDAPRLMREPHRLEATLRHELCHLVLGRYIRETPIPRWLDEGVCQWMSEGMGEVLTRGGEERLVRAAHRGSLIPLRRLGRFPLDREGILLAYAESRSVVEFVAAEWGREGVLSVLEEMRRGHTPGEAARAALGVGLDDIEKQWRESLRGRSLWLAWLRRHFTELLFVMAALLAVAGFGRVLWRMKTYRDPDEEAEAEEPVRNTESQEKQ
ncbi:MAG: peptidase MA family metallohydrolase [Nitrospirota bacterium]